MGSPETLEEVTGVTVLSFEEFLQAEHVRLARALYLLTGSTAEADELTQEAMVRVYERWDRHFGFLQQALQGLGYDDRDGAPPLRSGARSQAPDQAASPTIFMQVQRGKAASRARASDAKGEPMARGQPPEGRERL